MRTSLWVSVFVRFALAGLVFVAVAHADTVVPDLVDVTGPYASQLNLTTSPNYELIGWPTSTGVWLWREQEVYAPVNVPVNLDPANLNWLAATQYGPRASNPPYAFTNVAGVVPAGTLINSYLIHARWVSGDDPLTATFTLEFNFPVLGVIALNTQTGIYRYLTGSDYLGHPNVQAYPRSQTDDRGLDSAHSDDYIQLDSSKKLLTVSLRVGSGDTSAYDEIRILTAAPEPAAIALFGTVAAVLLGAVRWRKRRARC
jgi:hypothetical protein